MEEPVANHTVGLVGIDGSAALVSHFLKAIVSLLKWIVRLGNRVSIDWFMWVWAQP